MAQHIMVVDDDQQTRKLLRLVFERKGYQVSDAADGLAALHKLETVAPDLFVLDVMMPGMDGFELCRHLRSRAQTAFTPVIMFSAADSPKNERMSLEAGANAFMPKSSLPPILARRVEQLLGATRAEAH